MFVKGFVNLLHPLRHLATKLMFSFSPQSWGLMMFEFLLVMFSALCCALLIQYWAKRQIKLLRAKESILVRSFCLLDLDMRMENFYWRHCNMPMDPAVVQAFIERLRELAHDASYGRTSGATGQKLIMQVVYAVDRDHPTRWLFEQLAHCLGVFFSCSNARRYITIKDIATKLRDIHDHNRRLTEEIKNA